MRYFKYKNENTTEKNALKAQYAELTKDEKRLVRKGKVFNTIATILFFMISGGCFIGCVFLLKRIPISENIFLAVLDYIGIIFLGCVAFIVSLLIGCVASSPIWNKVNANHKVMKQNILSKACVHLREYYELQEPCIVTKCYEASDKNFTNHDVCIFVVDDELRITTNLKYGFFHGENDLGCYAFKLDEISLFEQQGEKFLMTELKSGNTVFLLGYRAKAFIEKHFISTENIT